MNGGGTPVDADGTTWLRRLLPYAAIVFLALVAYANTLSHPFIYDDSDIARSPLLNDPWNLRAIWKGDFYGVRKPTMLLYRPLSDWSCLLNYRVNAIVFGDGESPFGFHMVDILLHAAVACLMFAWLRVLKLARPICFFAVMIFVVHPLHTETVDSHVNRSDSLAALFGLAFLILHARRVPILPALLYALAMGGKESAAAFFPLAVAMDAIVPESAGRGSPSELPGGVRQRQRWPLPDYAVLAATLAAWLALRSGSLHGLPPTPTPIDNPLQAASMVDRILTAAVVQLRYLRLLIFPVGLSSDYSFDQIPVVHSLVSPGVLAFIGLLITCVAVGWKLRRSMPVVTLAILGYPILFSSTSNFLFPIGTIMGERLAYTPSILFCTLIGVGLGELRSPLGKRTIDITVGVLCCLCLWLTIQRNRTWSDPLTFCREQVKTAPKSCKAHVNLASALGNAGDDRGAMEEYERALEILPIYPGAAYQLGNALHRLKEDPERIVEAYHRAVSADPKDVNARVNLAWTLLDLQRNPEARAVVNEIRAIDPVNSMLPSLVKRLHTKRCAEAPLQE